MRALILLQSTTGNTRLVARYAAHQLSALGLSCELLEIHQYRDAHPSLEGVDLLGVAFPTMYLQPPLAMTRFVEQLTPPIPGLPAFVLCTAGGDPGGSRQLMCEQLALRGFAPLGAHWVVAPSNFPPQRIVVNSMLRLPVLGLITRLTTPLVRQGWTRSEAFRSWATTFYDAASDPQLRDRRLLEKFLSEVAQKMLEAGPGAQRVLPLPSAAETMMARAGRLLDVRRPISLMKLSCDRRRCTRCGECADACPVGCVQPDEEGHPRFGPGCTGCYACYNACANGALRAFWVRNGWGRYQGPTRQMHQLFEVR